MKWRNTPIHQPFSRHPRVRSPGKPCGRVHAVSGRPCASLCGSFLLVCVLVGGSLEQRVGSRSSPWTWAERSCSFFYCVKPAVLGSPLGGGSPEFRGLAFPPCGPVWLRLEAPCQNHPWPGERRECMEAPGWGRSGSWLCPTGHPWRGRPHSPTLDLRATLMEKGPVTD